MPGVAQQNIGLGTLPRIAVLFVLLPHNLGRLCIASLAHGEDGKGRRQEAAGREQGPHSEAAAADHRSQCESKGCEPCNSRVAGRCQAAAQCAAPAAPVQRPAGDLRCGVAADAQLHVHPPPPTTRPPPAGRLCHCAPAAQARHGRQAALRRLRPDQRRVRLLLQVHPRRPV